MGVDRRGFLAEARAPAPKPIKAVVFDAFTLFDPRVATPVAQRLYPLRTARVLVSAKRRGQVSC